MRTPILLTLLAVTTALLLCGCRAPSPLAESADLPVVRVRLLSQTDRVTLSARQTPRVTLAGQTVRDAAPVGRTVELTLDAGRWKLAGRPLGSGELLFEQASDGMLLLNGRRYRGRLRFVPVDSGKSFDVINELDVERYLYGVLARELYPHWHPEAYRAQAVAARTYAIFELRTRAGSRHFDLHADTRSQVYGGMDDETPKSVEAVNATRGLVLAYGPPGRERIFKAYYSSCCGGVTASATDTFNDPVIEPLQSQYVGPVCNQSPRFNWGPIVFTKDELTRRIRAYGQRRNSPERNIARVERIEIASTNPHGRPARFTVIDARGNRFNFTSEQIRWAINTDPRGGPTLPSGFFKTVNQQNEIRIVEGHGFGHGVGLCQHCTQARAAGGMPHRQILARAYPGAKLMTAYR